jgi:hypothetical protein
MSAPRGSAADEAADLVGGAEQGGAGVVHGVLPVVVGGGHAALIRSRNAIHVR